MKELVIFCLFGAILAISVEQSTFLKETDHYLNNEYKALLPNIDLKIFNEISKELETRIKAVKEWFENKADYSQCRLLPEIGAVLNGDVEKRTIGLKLVPKFRLRVKSSLMQKYQTILNQIDFWKKIPYLPIRVFLLEKNVVKAEQIQKKITREKDIHFRQYFKMIRDRIEKTIDKRLGPTLVYTMFQNATITLASNAQFNIIQNALKSLVECFESIQADQKYIRFIKYAKILLNNMKGYNFNDLENIVKKFNLLDDFNIQNRLLMDAKLIKLNEDLDWFPNDYDDDQVLDNVNNDDINNKLTAAENFHNFVMKITDFIDSLKYETINKTCQIHITSNEFIDHNLEKTIPPLEKVEVINKTLFDSIKNKAIDVKKYCPLIKYSKECINAITELVLPFKDLLLNKIIKEYNEFIQKIIRPDLGAIITKKMSPKLNEVCKLQQLTKMQYNLKSAEQLNAAVKIYENGKQCLMMFDQRVRNMHNFEKIIPQDVFDINLEADHSEIGCNIDGIKISLNIDKIIARDRIADEIKKNAVLELDF